MQCCSARCMACPGVLGLERRDEEELAVDEVDLVGAAQRPAAHLCEAQLAVASCGAALLRGHLPHRREPCGVDREAGGERYRSLVGGRSGHGRSTGLVASL